MVGSKKSDFLGPTFVSLEGGSVFVCGLTSLLQ